MPDTTITPTDTDARAASRERLRAAVAATLTDVHDHTTTPADAEETIMTAAQQWALEGYMISTGPAAAPTTHHEVWGGDPEHPHTWTWTPDDGNDHMGHVCPCGAFRL